MSSVQSPTKFTTKILSENDKCPDWRCNIDNYLFVFNQSVIDLVNIRELLVWHISYFRQLTLAKLILFICATNMSHLCVHIDQSV